MVEVTDADREVARVWLVNTPATEDWLGYEDQRALTQAFARHRLAERARIVAWLRESAPQYGHEQLADAIEAGGA